LILSKINKFDVKANVEFLIKVFNNFLIYLLLNGKFWIHLSFLLGNNIYFIKRENGITIVGLNYFLGKVKERKICKEIDSELKNIILDFKYMIF
jgi:hypothetical protein